MCVLDHGCNSSFGVVVSRVFGAAENYSMRCSAFLAGLRNVGFLDEEDVDVVVHCPGFKGFPCSQLLDTLNIVRSYVVFLTR